MTISQPRLRTLLGQARRTAKNGKRDAAAQLYRQITEEAPDAVAAWLGLAQTTRDAAERETAYRTALELDPGNETAKAGLAGDGDGDAPAAASEPDPEMAAVKAEEEEETAVLPGDAPPPKPAQTEAPAFDFAAADEDLVCYRHPARQTALRCYTCGRPICSQCAVKTPVGYRCPECVREAEDVFFNASKTDYLIAFLISLPLSLIAGWLVSLFSGGFFFILIIFFIGGAIGSLIGRLTKRAVGGRRGRYLPHLVAGMVAIGALIPATPALLFIFLGGNLGAITALLMPGIYIFVAGSAAYYQMT
jgi:hypothetical protein